MPPDEDQGRRDQQRRGTQGVRGRVCRADLVLPHLRPVHVPRDDRRLPQRRRGNHLPAAGQRRRPRHGLVQGLQMAPAVRLSPAPGHSTGLAQRLHHDCLQVCSDVHMLDYKRSLAVGKYHP